MTLDDWVEGMKNRIKWENQSQMPDKLSVFYTLLYNQDINMLLVSTIVSHACLSCNGYLVAMCELSKWMSS